MVCQLWMELNENEYQPHSHEDKHGQNGQNAFAGGAFPGFHPLEPGDAGITLGMNIPEQVFPAVAF